MTFDAKQQVRSVGNQTTKTTRLRNQGDSDSNEDEPWDQRQRMLGNYNAASRRQSPPDPQQEMRRQQHLNRTRIRIVDDDGDLDDGDLPSLSSRPMDDSAFNRSNISNAMQNGQLRRSPATKGLGAIPVTPSPHSNRGSEPRGYFVPPGHREDDDESGPHYSRSNYKAHFADDDDAGPDDEMDARKRSFHRRKKSSERRRRRSRGSGGGNGRYDDDSDNSSEEFEVARTGTFDTDSNYTGRSRDADEEEYEVEEAEEDEYEQTFCGQTLNALGDICGIGAAAKSPKKKKLMRRVVGNRETQEKTQTALPLNDQPSKASSTTLAPTNSALHSTILTPPPLGSASDDNKMNQNNKKFVAGARQISLEDTLQENTVIEVEFVEPKNPLAPDRKNAYLDALEQKAKKDYEGKMKDRQKLVPAELAEIKPSDIHLQETIPLKRTTSEGAKSDHSIKSEEDVYNSMTAAEKRKFLKYINSGLSPYDANYMVRSDRQAQKERELSAQTNAGEETAKNENGKREKDGEKESPKAKKQNIRSKMLGKAVANGKRLFFGKQPKSNGLGEHIPQKPRSPESAASTESPLREGESDVSVESMTQDDEGRDSQPREGNQSSGITPPDAMESHKLDNQPFKISGVKYYDGIRRDENDEQSQDQFTPQHVSRPKSPSSERKIFPFSRASKGSGFEELKDEMESNNDQNRPPESVTIFNGHDILIGSQHERSSTTLESSLNGPIISENSKQVEIGNNSNCNNTTYEKQQQTKIPSHTITEHLDIDRSVPYVGTVSTDDHIIESAAKEIECHSNEDELCTSEENRVVSVDRGKGGNLVSVANEVDMWENRGSRLSKTAISQFSDDQDNKAFHPAENTDKVIINGKQLHQPNKQNDVFETGQASKAVSESVLPSNQVLYTEVDESKDQQRPLPVTANMRDSASGSRSPGLEGSDGNKCTEDTHLVVTTKKAETATCPSVIQEPGFPPIESSSTTWQHVESYNINQDRIHQENSSKVISSTHTRPVSYDTKISRGYAQDKPFDETELHHKDVVKHVELHTNDISIDAYFNAVADTSPRKPVSHDGMSVYTIGTNITGGSTYTQSSRVRRPGAAKTRLARQKQVESKVGKKNGWHESIKAAAASTNRVWDPIKGWVDYHDPDADIIPESSFEHNKEKIHLDLDKSILSSKAIDSRDISDSSTIEPGVPVPFPSEWEKERLAMLKSFDDSRYEAALGSVMHDENEEVLKGKSNFMNDTKPLPGSTSVESSKTKGWVESMKAASAALTSSGMKWDPIHGWTSLDEKRPAMPDAVDFNDHRARVHDEQDYLYDNRSQQQHVLEIEETGDRLSLLAPPRDGKKLVFTATRPNGNSEKYKKQNNLESIHRDVHGYHKRVIPQDYEDTLDMDTGAISGTSERSNYRSDQVGGAVRMIEEKEGFAMVRVETVPSRIDNKDGATPRDSKSINGQSLPFSKVTESFPSTDEILSSSMVDVVRERVGSEDLELFPLAKSGSPQPADKSKDSSFLRTDLSKVEQSRSFGESVDSSFRRGAGPVDVDEVDDTWDSDDDKRQSNGWQSEVKDNLNRSSNSNNLSRSSNGSNLNRSSNSSKSVLDAVEDHIKGWKSTGMSPGRGTIILEADESRASESGNLGFEVGDYIVPRYMSSDGRSGVSTSTKGSAKSSCTKKVPKLERSKRDTSPIGNRSSSRIGVGKASNNSSLASKVEQFRHDEYPVLADEKKDDRAHIFSGGSSPHQDFSDDHRIDVLVEQENIGGVEERKSAGADSVQAEDMYTYSPDQKHPRQLFDHSNGNLHDDFAVSPSVKDRLQEWETRIEKSESADLEDSGVSHDLSPDQKQTAPKGSVEWKSFMNKKVQAESAAAVGQPKYHRESINKSEFPTKFASGANEKTIQINDDDTLFSFREPKKNRGKTVENTPSAHLDEISDLSPINHKDDSSDNDQAETTSGAYGSAQEETTSEAYGPTQSERGASSFFQRLSACTAPMMPNTVKTADGSPHLDFLRSIPNYSVGKQASQLLPVSMRCVQPDNVEDGEVSLPSHEIDSLERQVSRGVSFGEEKPRSISAPRSLKIPPVVGTKTSSSSVVSEDFGAKTAYLEALAMRAAVAKPKRASSRRRASGGSSVTSGATDSSEKWRAFLERKRAAGSSPLNKRTNSNSDVSKAAEKYAAEKVEEIMLKMASRSKSAPKSTQYQNDIDRMFDTSGEKPEERKIARKKGSSVKAAEDLAAARVEAMMAALSTNQLDEGEI